MSSDLFAGRLKQIEQVCDAINERGQHFVVYGERGVGKTSLANIINEHIVNVVISKVTSNRDEDFRNIWDKALSKVRFERERQGIGFTAEKISEPVQMNLFLPDKEEIDSIDIQTTLEGVNANLCFVVDELDAISDEGVMNKFSDTIKALSDNAPFVTVGLIGIADNVQELIGSHRSLERCLKQIRMPRMSKDELRSIVDKGMELLDMRMPSDIRESIVSFSSGFPHFTHLLAKFSAKECILEGETVISESHYERAIDLAVENSNQSIRDAYQKATMASKAKSRFSDVIAACALADADEHGTFAAHDLIEPYYNLTGERLKPSNFNYNINRLCEVEKGAVLEKLGESKNIRYRFTNPLMKVFVKMKVAQSGTFLQKGLFG